MIWLIIGLALAVALVGGIRVWRHWIDPWREVEELTADVLAGRPPRKFLMSANARAQKIGLEIEKIAERLNELDRTAREGTLSVQTILGALPDGLVVVDEGGRI